MAVQQNPYEFRGSSAPGEHVYNFETNRNIYTGNATNAAGGYTPDQVKQWFADNPNASNEHIAQTASNLGMSAGNVAQALSIGRGDAYSPDKVNEWIGSQSKFTVGNDGIITDGSRGPGPVGSRGEVYTGGSVSGSSQSGGGGGALNPYLDDMARAVTNQMADNYQNNIAPQNRSGAMAVGGFGGSRQGVIDANAGKMQSQALGNSLANLYGTGWQNAQQNSLQEKSMNNQFELGSRGLNNQYDLGLRGLNNQYDLGLRSSDLGFANLDANIANSNFSNQLNAANFGLNANNSMNQQTGAAIQGATNMQMTPIQYQKYFADQANQAGGQGGSTSGTQTGASNPLMGAIGGGVAGWDLYKQYQKSQQPTTST